MQNTLDVEEIQALLPHRFPMLLVDRILELEPGVRVTGLKNVTINEPFFTGHFPGMAVMPGVLIVEAMAQVAGLMLLVQPQWRGKLFLLAGIDKARFRRPVVPGDTLVTEAKLLWKRETIGKVSMVARVEGVVVAEGEMMFAIKEPVTAEQVHARLEQGYGEGNGAAGNSAGGYGDVRHVNTREEEFAARGDGDCE
jgi:3-hydroxyacyl-[acyl-carrier-protein] dehydratase